MENEKDPMLEVEIEEEIVQSDDDSSESSDLIDIEKADLNLDSDVPQNSDFSDIDETNEENKQELFEIKLLQKRRTLKWVFSLFVFIILFVAISVVSLIFVKNRYIKPSVITKISDYIKSSNLNNITISDNEIVYKPNKIINGISVDDLKNLIYATSKYQTKFNFQFYKITKDGKKEQIDKILENDILDSSNKFSLYLSFQGDKNNIFSIDSSQYKEIPFKIDLSKQLFLYNEQNSLIYKAPKTMIYSEVLNIMKESSKNIIEAFYKTIDKSIKDVYLPDDSINPKYAKLFLQKSRNEYIAEKDLQDILSTNTNINKLYLDNFTDDSDTIFRFHNTFNEKVYEIKIKKGSSFNSEVLTRIREKIKLPNGSYYLKDGLGNLYFDNFGNKYLIDGNDKYEIENFLTDLNDPNSFYDFSKPCYYPLGLSDKKETYLKKEYRIIDIYTKIKIKKANLLFRTKENELIKNYNFSCGPISRMPLDLGDINLGNKFFDTKKQYFYGWKVVNDDSTLTFDDIKNGKFYNLTDDIILEPIIKNKITATINLPHEDYKPSTLYDKNYEFLTLSLKEDDNLYTSLLNKMEEIKKTIPYFNGDNEFLGMYTDINYLSKIENNTYARDIINDTIIYFRYKITYVKIDFPNFFKNLYSETLKYAKLDIPIDEATDVVDGNILYNTYFEKLVAQNKNSSLDEIFHRYFISKNKYSFNKSGRTIILKVYKEIKANINVMAYDINKREFFASSSCQRDYEIMPLISNVLRYIDKEQISTDDTKTKLNYLAYPYFAYDGVVYKILSISSDYLFRNNLLSSDKIDKLEYIKNNNIFYFPIYLSVEKTNIDISYRYIKDGKVLYEKTIKSYYSPFNYSSLKLNDKLNEFGYKLIKNSENTFPKDYEFNPEYYINNSSYFVEYHISDLENSKKLEYVYFKMKFQKQIYDELRQKKITKKEDFVGAYPYAYKNNYNDIEYFLTGKNIFFDYDGIKNLFLSAFYHFTKHKFDDYFKLDKYVISGFIYYKNGNSVKNLEFLNGPISPKDKYVINDGMMIDFEIKKA